jgi:hypothetical protein
MFLGIISKACIKVNPYMKDENTYTHIDLTYNRLPYSYNKAFGVL